MKVVFSSEDFERFAKDHIGPEDLTCVIQHEVVVRPMRNPQSPKYIFEECAIRRWLRISATDPMTRAQLTPALLQPDHQSAVRAKLFRRQVAAHFRAEANNPALPEVEREAARRLSAACTLKRFWIETRRRTDAEFRRDHTMIRTCLKNAEALCATLRERQDPGLFGNEDTAAHFHVLAAKFALAEDLQSAEWCSSYAEALATRDVLKHALIEMNGLTQERKAAYTSRDLFDWLPEEFLDLYMPHVPAPWDDSDSSDAASDPASDPEERFFGLLQLGATALRPPQDTDVAQPGDS